MRTLTDRLPQQPDTLLVLLPGAHTELEDFGRHGFIEAVRHRRIETDILTAGFSYRMSAISYTLFPGLPSSTFRQETCEANRVAGATIARSGQSLSIPIVGFI